MNASSSQSIVQSTKQKRYLPLRNKKKTLKINKSLKKKVQTEEKERLKLIKQQQRAEGKLTKSCPARAKKVLQFPEIPEIKIPVKKNTNLALKKCETCGNAFKNCNKQSEWRSCEECDKRCCQICTKKALQSLDSTCC